MTQNADPSTAPQVIQSGQTTPPDLPDQRPFGSQVAKSGKFNFGKYNKMATITAAVSVALLGVYAVNKSAGQQTAPKINLEALASNTGAPIQADKANPISNPAAEAPQASASASSPEISLAMAAPASAPTAAASEPKSRLEVSAIDLTPPHKTDEEYSGEITTLQEKVDRLTKELRESRNLITSLQKQIKIASAKAADPDEFVALTIIDINAKGVLVSDASRQYLVEPGARLPGGATYIGFDPASHLMKTDRGDFVIN